MRLVGRALWPIHRRFPLFQPEVIPFSHPSVLGRHENSLEAADDPSIDKLPLGVYAHFPFCPKRCPYCKFNVYVQNSEKPLPLTNLARQWRQQLRRDVNIYNTDSTHRVTSIYFGGGTPFMADYEHISDFIACTRSVMEVAPDAEITLEMNPMTVTHESMKKLEELRKAGVNRISVGVQSLDTNNLQFLGREHTPEQAIKTLALVSHIFPRVTCDILYGFPNQSPSMWKNDLQSLIKQLPASVKHISAYKLTIDYGTKLYWDLKDGFFKMPDDKKLSEMYDTTLKVTSAAGFVQYEQSNFCRDKDYSRHNLLMWRGYDYMGIGPGSHGRLTVYRTRNKYHMRQRPAPAVWIDSIERNGHGMLDEDKLTPVEYSKEVVSVGLRPLEGLCKNRFERLVGVPLHSVISKDGLDKCVKNGLLVDEANLLKATNPKGVHNLREIIDNLFPNSSVSGSEDKNDRKAEIRDGQRDIFSPVYMG